MNRVGYLALILGAGAIAGTLCFVRPVSSEEENHGRMRAAIEILRRLETGAQILAKAQRAWGESAPLDLLGHFRWGKASKTDAVITRHYNPRTGEERRERQVVVYVRLDQSLEDTVMDMAHELVHATSRPAWDPYDPGLTPAAYIASAIDGEGGEVDALLLECRVSLEMASRFGSRSERCQRYLSKNPDGGLERESIRRDFYRVGRWRAALEQKLGRSALAKFPLLSDEAPGLFSSTGQAPYPVALYQEYRAITDVACENTARRARASSEERGPASVPAQLFLKSRCRSGSEGES